MYGLKMQLDKICITPPTLLVTVASLLMNILPSPIKFRPISKACCYRIRQLQCIHPQLDTTTACTMCQLHRSSENDYCNSLYCNTCNRFRTLLPVLLLKFLNLVTSLAQNNRTHQIHTPLTHLKTHNHPSSIFSWTHLCMLNLLAALAFQLTLLSLDHQYRPCYVWLIAPLVMPHSVSGIIFLVLPINLIPVHLSLWLPASSSHSVSSPLSPSITPSLFHSRLKVCLFHKSFPP